MKRKILIYDNNKQNERLITKMLNKDYELIISLTTKNLIDLISIKNPDIILLDPFNQEKSAKAIINSIRYFSQCPIIVVSDNNTESAVTTILEAGADDYITKPYYQSELLARIKVAIKHIEQLESSLGVKKYPFYYYDNLKVNYDNHEVLINDIAIHLTKNEMKILTLLCKNSGKILTYDYIMKSIWGINTPMNTGILRVNITNIRKKIEKDKNNPHYIFTQSGVGYKIASDKAKKEMINV